MKLSYLIIILLLFSATNSISYVLNCPGTIYYATNQEITFSDCVNSSYWEVGPDYFWLSDMNFTLEDLSSYFCNYNLSFFNDTFDNHTSSEVPYRFFEFNCTYTNIDTIDVIMDLPSDYFLVDLYIDNVLTHDDVEEGTSTYDFEWSNDGNSHRLCFYIDGYITGCPTGGASSYDGNSQTVNLTWSPAAYAYSYVVVRNNVSFPSTPTDGDVVQNNSHTYYNTSISSNGYFTIWSYNNSGQFSANSCKLDIPWGGLEVNVFKETNPSIEITDYDVFIKNLDGSEVYYNTSQNNPFRVDILNVPNGNDIAIQISADGYKSRTRYVDLPENIWNNLTFYLPPSSEGSEDKDEDDPDYIPDEDDSATVMTNISTVVDYTTDETVVLGCQPSQINSVEVYNQSTTYWEYVSNSLYNYTGSVLTVNRSALTINMTQIRVVYLCGYSETYAEHYILRVIDETNNPVGDCLITIKRYINTTDSYNIVYAMYTDSNGEQSADLIPDAFYIVVLNHSSGEYQNESHDWQPPEINYVEDTLKTFILEYTEDESAIPDSIDEHITFTLENAGNTLFINFTCDYPSVTDLQITVYEENSSTLTTTLFNYSTYTNQDNVYLELTVNSSNSYIVTLDFNHTAFSHWHSVTKWFKTVDFADWDKPTSPDKINKMITDLLGTNPFLWGNFILWLFVVAMFFYIDPKESGKFMVFIGGILMFLDVVVGFVSLVLVIPLLMIVLGLMVIWRNSSRKGA